MKLEPLEPSYYYHFFNRGNNRENIFIEVDNYDYFIKLIKKYLLAILDIYSYCLLPNHFHLVFKIKPKQLLPKKIKEDKMTLYQPFSNMFNAYTKAFNKKYNRVGSLFQKHPKRIRILNEDYLRRLILYVNTNSDHHGIANYKGYKFSSYSELVTEKSKLLSKSEVITLFDDVENLKFALRQKKINIEAIKDIILE
ncbi:MAG: transposase [Flavobacteriaceae bacterium]|nr:transposase [Flavobacteriaceae bacterium]